MRLIDVDDLIDFIDCGHLRNPGESCFSERDVVDMLEARPAVDGRGLMKIPVPMGGRKEGATMTNSEALECFESDCETCQFKGRDCKSCRTRVAISALRREIKN